MPVRNAFASCQARCHFGSRVPGWYAISESCQEGECCREEKEDGNPSIQIEEGHADARKVAPARESVLPDHERTRERKPGEVRHAQFEQQPKR